MKRLLIIWFVLIASMSFAYPTEDSIRKISGGAFGWDATNGKWVPFAANATGVSSVSDTAVAAAVATVATNVTTEGNETQAGIATTNARLLQVEAAASGTTAKIESENGKTLGTLATFSTSLNAKIETETAKTLGSLATMSTSADTIAAGIRSEIATMATNFAASPTADPTVAFSTMLGLSDNSGIKRWFAAIVLGDGVNGNNTGAVAPWVWNGTTYDRARGNASDGVMVYENLCTSISTQTYTATATSQDITPLTNRKWISIQNQGTGTVTLHAGGSPAVYGSGRLIYSQGSIVYSNIDDSVVFSIVSNTGESNTVYVEQGVK